MNPNTQSPLVRRWKIIPPIVALLCLIASTQQVKRPFAVADDVEVAVFGGTWGVDEGLLLSPDGNYFVVETERGRSDLDSVEDSLRFYRCRDVAEFLESSSGAITPSPVWEINRSAGKGHIFTGWRWLPDSSGLAFRERTVTDDYRLVLADLGKKMSEPLTGDNEAVGQFDVRDRQHYIYTARDVAGTEGPPMNRDLPAIVGTGHSLRELLFPDSPIVRATRLSSTMKLWAVVGGKRLEVTRAGVPLVPSGGLALSPDATSVVTAVDVPEVPQSWPVLYPPPYPSSPYRFHAGRGSAHQYVRINLETGSVQSLTDAPISSDITPWASVFIDRPSWSSDGQAILLPGTFLKSRENVPSRPCVAVVDVPSITRSCVEMLKGLTETGTEEGFHQIQEVRFEDGDKQRVSVCFRRRGDLYSFETTSYRRTTASAWQLVRQREGVSDIGRDGLEIRINEGLNDPPTVVAKYKQESRVIWDPNPQLKNLELGSATIYTWKDKEGRHWRGGLFMPRHRVLGKRYPLVIQTHGFTESKFIPSGIFPTTFAARALAAEGIVVLQVPDLENCLTVTVHEVPCAVSGYEAAVKELVSEGLVNPDKVGIVGFSRSCFYVMDVLTLSSLRIKAASITDGVMGDYFQYIAAEDLFGNSVAREFDSMIGAKPFGEGLQDWLKRSPGFNLDKVRSPVLFNAEGPRDLLSIWAPYAALRYLKRPVDLIILNTDEHVLSNPAVRIASQGGSVDWFRFWLQDYEDPDPVKADQYERWRLLRTMQKETDTTN